MILFSARSPTSVSYAVARWNKLLLHVLIRCFSQIFLYIENICFERSSQNNFIRCTIVVHSELPFWILLLRWKFLFSWTMSTCIHYFRANFIDSIFFAIVYIYVYCFDQKHEKLKFIQNHNSWQRPFTSRQYFAVMIFITYLMTNNRLSTHFNYRLNR